MRLTRNDLTYAALWLLASILTVALAMLFSSASLIDGEYIPVGNDAFYLARRILDAVSGDPGFYQFDPAIHVPEGSWLTVPWGYTYFASRLIIAMDYLGIADGPGTLLAYIPVVFAVVNVGLFALVLRSAGIRPVLASAALLAFALSPLNQVLHGVGAVDHHFLELCFVLLTIWLGLRWSKRPDSVARATALGVSLGGAPAFHTGLFILQLPLLLAIGIHWAKGGDIERRGAITLAVALVVACLVFLLPAAPFRHFRFEFATHSWFHLYVAASSAVVIVLLSRLESDVRGWAVVAIVSVAFAFPIVTEAGRGVSFLAGTTTLLDQVTEVYSPYRMFRNSGEALAVTRYYSWLILLAPAFVVVAGWRLFVVGELTERFLMAAAIIGLVLLQLQFRLHPFGYWAILAIGVLLLQHLTDRLRLPPLGSAALGLAVVAVAYQPPLRAQLFELLPPGLSAEYATTRPLYLTLGRACRQSPGVVLASTDDGHPIRYHSDCSVIANNMLLTPQHGEKVIEVDRLMHLSPVALRKDGLEVDYVLIRLNGLFDRRDGVISEVPTARVRAANPPLANALTAESIPDGFELVDELRTNDARELAFARLLRVVRDQDDDVGSANPGI